MAAACENLLASPNRAALLRSRPAAAGLALAGVELRQVPQRADEMVRLAPETAENLDQACLRPAATTRIVGVGALGDEMTPAPRCGLISSGAGLAINAVDLFARANTGFSTPAPTRWRSLAARPAVGKPHLPGLRSCRDDAPNRCRSSAGSREARVPRFLIGKPRPPHQRPVTEHPQIVSGCGHGGCLTAPTRAKLTPGGSSRTRSRRPCCRCRPWGPRSRRRTCRAPSRAPSGPR